MAIARDTIRLAFVPALQHLPPRQRAVLILREVLRWHADEVAELLESSVASVNSALQRARATLARPAQRFRPPSRWTRPQELLARYVDAFERYDIESLTALLHEDAIEHAAVRAVAADHEDIFKWWSGPGSDVTAPAGAGRPPTGHLPCAVQARSRAALEPWSIQVLEVRDGRISGLTFFLDTARLFPLFGLPLSWTRSRHTAPGRRTARPAQALGAAPPMRRAA